VFNKIKRKVKGRNTADEKLARKSRGNDSGRKTWGFPCSPDIKARMKMLADRLHVPLYALTEHAVQLSAGLIATIAEHPEECELLRQHILDDHVGRRMIEKISRYDQDMADILDEERHRRFQIDNAVRRIVLKFGRAGLTPREIEWYIGYGMRCRIAIGHGQPVPTDSPEEA
jgi:hypothetical protein